MLAASQSPGTGRGGRPGSSHWPGPQARLLARRLPRLLQGSRGAAPRPPSPVPATDALRSPPRALLPQPQPDGTSGARARPSVFPEPTPPSLPRGFSGPRPPASLLGVRSVRPAAFDRRPQHLVLCALGEASCHFHLRWDVVLTSFPRPCLSCGPVPLATCWVRLSFSRSQSQGPARGDPRLLVPALAVPHTSSQWPP